MSSAPLIYINAFPGTGKLTIARCLLTLFPKAILLDNHCLIDPVAAKYPREHPEYLTERRKEREKAFEKYVKGEEWKESWIVCIGMFVLSV